MLLCAGSFVTQKAGNGQESAFRYVLVFFVNATQKSKVLPKRSLF